VTDANDEQLDWERISEIMARNAEGSLADLTETLLRPSDAMGGKLTMRPWYS